MTATATHVCDEPLIAETIARYLGNGDLVRWKCGWDSTSLRFHETVDALLRRRHHVRNKRFVKSLNRFLHHHESLTRVFDQVRNLDALFAFLGEHLWFRREFETLSRIVEKKLIEWMSDHDGEYSHNAEYHLSEIYDIHVRAEHVPKFNIVTTYVDDTRGVRHVLDSTVVGAA